MAKQNVKASLIVYASLPELGWRRGSLVPAKTGFRTDAMMFNGLVYKTPNPTFQIRTYEGSKAQYKSVGSDLAEAQKRLKDVQVTRNKNASDAWFGIERPKPTEEPKTLGELADQYIARKSKKTLDLSDASIQHYKAAVLGFLDVNESLKTSPVSAVTEDHIIDFIEFLNEQEYSEATQGQRYIALRGFLRRSGVDVDKVIDESTHAKFAEKAKSTVKVDGYDDADLDTLLTACDDYHWTVFQFLRYTGMRYREANHMTWEWVDFQKGVIKIPRKDAVKRTFFSRKAGKVVTTDVQFKVKSKSGAREVPIFDTLLPILKKWRKQHPDTTYVFGTKRDLPDGHWLEYGNAAWRRAGLDCGQCEGCKAHAAGSRTAGCEAFFLHRFRHTFGHRCADANVDLDKLCKWMGHHSVEVTRENYLRGRDYKATFDPFAVPVAVLVAAAA
ncbi:MAG: tyrosine-type recombinase/integrase [Terracidiphilus sp.]